MENVCLDCGLCCDGTLLTHAPLLPDDDMVGLSKWPLRIKVVQDESRMLLPCPACQGGCCTTYQHRPAICAAYRCALRIGYDAGSVTADEARVLIAAVVTLRDQIRPALEELTGLAGLHSLGELFQVAVARLEGLDAQDPQTSQGRQLMLDMAALEVVLSRHFRSGEPIFGSPARRPP